MEQGSSDRRTELSSSLALKDYLYQEITCLMHGKELNVNSPKQVAMAIFGRPQKATKAVLQQAMTNSTLSPQKQRLAQCILEYKKQVQASNNMSTIPTRTSATPATTIASEEQWTSPDDTATQSAHLYGYNYAQDSAAARSSPQRDQVELTNRKRTLHNSLSHDQLVERLFHHPKSQVDPYWKEPLLALSKSTARSLLTQLDPTLCPMGYDPNASPSSHSRIITPTTTIMEGRTNPSPNNLSTAGKKGTFLAYCRRQKELYPHCLLLVRCGDFYETFGIDAILLVEHVGLNSMAGKCRAGCPVKNIQPTVDALTQQGFSVAVHEEIATVDTTRQSSSKRPQLKTRVLTQIVSPASPTYLYDSWLLNTYYNNNGGGTLEDRSLDGLPPSRPCVGIIQTSAGYAVVEVSMEERSVHISERLTPEAVACRLTAYPPAEPLLYIPSRWDYMHHHQQQQQRSSSSWNQLPFLPTTNTRQVTVGPDDSTVVESILGGFRLRTKILPPTIMAQPTPGLTDVERYKNLIVQTFLRLTDLYVPEESEHETVNDQQRRRQRQHHHSNPPHVDDFSLISTATTMNGKVDDSSKMGTTTPNPLYLETATQLGLLVDHGKSSSIPSLVSYVLDETAPAPTRRLIQRYLLIPPPPHVATSMATVVDLLMNDDIALPPLTITPLGKVLALLRAGQANARIYGEILHSLSTTEIILQDYSNRPMRDDGSNGNNNDDDNDNEDSTARRMISSLMTLLQHESGLASDAASLLERCRKATMVIEDVISPVHHVNSDVDEKWDKTTQDDWIPASFLERNENPWRGRVKRDAARSAYDLVEKTAAELSQAVLDDFTVHSKHNDGSSNTATPIVQDVFNNLIAIKEIPSWVGRKHSESKVAIKEKEAYFHPRDRHGKLLRNRYTTSRVQFALAEYVSACEAACEEVSIVLTNLAQRLYDEGHIAAIAQAAHVNLILSAAFHHATKATKMGWHLAQTFEQSNGSEGEDPLTAQFVHLWPYWMHPSEAISNTFELEGLFLLTAPNMSGKSTLMRSTAAAALLTVCGFCAPLHPESRIPRFDTLFLRGASADVPSEDKSAFGAEMGDIAALMRCCGPKSLVFVDELGRGTSPKDGTRLAGAVLEAMAKAGMTGIFATHLHDILELPLEAKDRIFTKRMAIEQTPDGSCEWTYRLEDGVCTDSLALVTAARFGLPDDIIQRAEELAKYLQDGASVSSEMTTLTENYAETDSLTSSELDSTEFSVNELSTRPSSGGGSRHPTEQFLRAVALAEDVTGLPSIFIPPQWNPPASLANKSCVYVLELLQPSTKTPRMYVGETDSLSQRLRQHRKKGGAWLHSRAIALPVESKTQARAWESVLIQRLAQSGFDLESITDGRTLRHF